jgi:hypothetical protein
VRFLVGDGGEHLRRGIREHESERSFFSAANLRASSTSKPASAPSGPVK